MRWRSSQRRPSVGADDGVYILDVTEHWYNGQHSYWAFTEPSWYLWATGDDPGPPPRIIAKTNKATGDMTLPDEPTRNDRTLFVYYGGVQLNGGHYIGAEPDELAAWLGGRTPLGVLDADEYDSPAQDDSRSSSDE